MGHVGLRWVSDQTGRSPMGHVGLRWGMSVSDKACRGLRSGISVSDGFPIIIRELLLYEPGLGEEDGAAQNELGLELASKLLYQRSVESVLDQIHKIQEERMRR